MTFVTDAKKASLWLKANRRLLHANVEEPWVVTATYDDIFAFVQQYNQGSGFRYCDVRDHLLFDFHNEDDLRLFFDSTSSSFLCNVCLFGADYLANNLDFN